MTTKEQDPVFPAVSVDVHSTVVSPASKKEPDGGEQITKGEASTLSIAVASVKITPDDEPITVISDGQPASKGASSSALKTNQLNSKTTISIASIYFAQS